MKDICSVIFRNVYDFLISGGVFIVIFLGIGLAILTLIFEYVYYKDKINSQVDNVDDSMMHVKKIDDIFKNTNGNDQDEVRKITPVSIRN